MFGGRMARSLLSFALFVLPSSLLTVAAEGKCWRDTVCTGPSTSAFPGEWDSYIYAPSSRTVSPKSILSLKGGDVISGYPGPVILSGDTSALVFDFGIEVGGIVSLEFTSSGGSKGALGLAFTEAKNYIGKVSDSSNGNFTFGDGAIYANFSAAGEHSYVMPDAKLRGGFRYLTLFLNDEDIAAGVNVNVGSIELEIGFQPTWSNLRAYSGYFKSSDELLNRIWYAGAYTLQTNSAPVNTGRQFPLISSGWSNDGILGNGSTIILDGAKRDRTVWPGDMGVAVPAVAVSTGEMESVKWALQVMYDHQNATGAIPESGPPLLQLDSDTYHMWTMIGTYNYVLFTNDMGFLDTNWDRYLRAMDYVYGKVGETGLLNVSGTRDWARLGQGWNNSEANMILYHTLITGASLADWKSNPSLSATWTSRAASLQSAINKYLFDEDKGLYRDNATLTSVYPQDANSLSILFGVASSDMIPRISSGLTGNWRELGAETPELPGNISPFISSFEIQAHFLAGEAERALELIRRTWGWYINNKNGTESTVIEGFLTNGSFGYRSYRGYGYDSSYPSHAHGWSAGPTSVLTNYLLGLSITSPVGKTWKFAPSFGDVESAEGGFSTALGKFRASWSKKGSEVSLEWEVPADTQGTVVLPNEIGKEAVLYQDGEEVDVDFRQSQESFEFAVSATTDTYKLNCKL
ncbi:putative alpha-L-rhamnosidase B [Phyllosticta citribraziliensis]|uniref:Alpha-L-rhamnosidase B n=1 Tax=Phyllosticta citribraziliensis TaxID=989973 RepID=A0ABR1LQG9_9PEZI